LLFVLLFARHLSVALALDHMEPEGRNRRGRGESAVPLTGGQASSDSMAVPTVHPARFRLRPGQGASALAHRSIMPRRPTAAIQARSGYGPNK
jgi:hypothetical protein